MKTVFEHWGFESFLMLTLVKNDVYNICFYFLKDWNNILACFKFLNEMLLDIKFIFLKEFQ